MTPPPRSAGLSAETTPARRRTGADCSRARSSVAACVSGTDTTASGRLYACEACSASSGVEAGASSHSMRWSRCRSPPPPRCRTARAARRARPSAPPAPARSYARRSTAAGAPRRRRPAPTRRPTRTSASRRTRLPLGPARGLGGRQGSRGRNREVERHRARRPGRRAGRDGEGEGGGPGGERDLAIGRGRVEDDARHEPGRVEHLHRLVRGRLRDGGERAALHLVAEAPEAPLVGVVVHHPGARGDRLRAAEQQRLSSNPSGPCSSVAFTLAFDSTTRAILSPPWPAPPRSPRG